MGFSCLGGGYGADGGVEGDCLGCEVGGVCGAVCYLVFVRMEVGVFKGTYGCGT